MKSNILLKNKYCCKCLHNNKLKNYFMINNHPYCYNHASLTFNKYIIIIQKFYRAYKCKRYIKIYKKLPADLQYKIKEKINYNHNTYKLYNKLQYIIINKSTILYNNDSITIDQISNLYTLFYKYFNTIHLSYLKYYFMMGKKLQLFNYKILYPELYYFYMDPLYLKIDEESISFDNIYNCSNIINNFIIYYIHRSNIN